MSCFVLASVLYIIAGYLMGGIYFLEESFNFRRPFFSIVSLSIIFGPLGYWMLSRKKI